MDIKQSSKNEPMRIISITGGKGGIGKTTLSVNLAIALAKTKKKVLLFDADLGLANVNVLLGIHAARSLYDVFMGHCSLQDVCITGPHGIKIIPSSSGIQKMADLAPKEYVSLIQSFSLLVDEIDVMIVDMASGISSQVIDFTNASQDVLVVICNEPASLMDGYAVLKILHQKYGRKRFGIVVNKTKHPSEGIEVYQKFQDAAHQFMDVSMHYLGDIPYDDYVHFAAQERTAVVDSYPQSPIASAFSKMCHSINSWREDQLVGGGIHYFFEKLVQL